jgi:salicylate hydroxylase
MPTIPGQRDAYRGRMATQKPRVAVVGAGIGGLAAAAALHRAGFPVDVYEQAPRLREVGVGLHLAPNGSRILHRWGLAERLREVAVCPEALEIRGWSDGRTLRRQPMGASWAGRYGAPHYTVHRGDLHRLLADQVPADRIRLNHRLAGCTAADDRVRLTFAGGHTAEADVLVGADGTHSTVRRLLMPDTDAAVFSGTSAFRGLLPAAEVPGLSPDTMYVWVGAPVRLLCYPVSAGRAMTFVAVVPDAAWDQESWSAPGDPADLAAALAGWNDDARAIAAAARDVRRWALYDRKPLPAWGTGRVTLLGDAAHPMLPHHGQGASQAIEDAVALAHFLAAPGASGLRGYEDLRRPHTAKVQLGSRGSGTLRLTGGGLGEVVEDVSWVQEYDVARELTVRRAPLSVPTGPPAPPGTVPPPRR